MQKLRVECMVFTNNTVPTTGNYICESGIELWKTMLLSIQTCKEHPKHYK